VKRIISSVIKRITAGDVEVSSSTVQISRSIITAFVVRLKQFTAPAFERFCNSAIAMTARIQSYASSDSREQSYVKYWLDSLMVKIAGDTEFPVRDDWNLDPLFSGWMRWYVQRAIARKDVSFIYSLQKGSKQSWPAMSDEKLQQTLDKHKERLSRPYKSIPEGIFKSIRSTSSKVFGGEMNLTKFAPSPSACLQAPRSKGGASSLFLQFEFPTVGECARIGKLRAIQHSLTKWRLDQFKLSEEEVAKGIADFMDGNQHILKCCVVAIPEPGKFRVITKGDGFLYTYLQPLQGYLLDAWRSTKYSTMKKADLYQQVNDIDRNVDFFDDWCSGDYEAATDLLNKDACLAALYGLLEYDESNFVMEAIFSMTGSELHYPDGTSIWQLKDS